MTAEPLKFDMTEAELRDAAVRLLSAREHSKSELRRKLARKCDDAELIASVVDALSADGYQSDQRFAASKARSGVSRRHGPMKIRQTLKQAGVQPELIAETLDGADVDWYAEARSALQSKFGDQPANDRKEQARRARFLQSRGYPMNIVASLILDR